MSTQKNEYRTKSELNSVTVLANNAQIYITEHQLWIIQSKNTTLDQKISPKEDDFAFHKPISIS